jgi:hypothetical protein
MTDAKTAIVVEKILPYPPETVWRLLRLHASGRKPAPGAQRPN